jgi:nitrite reductase/ring-hydroxylating ferredoxin subunit
MPDDWQDATICDEEPEMPTPSHQPADDAATQPCDGCPLTVDRRAFLRAAALATLGVAVAGSAASAFGATVASVRPRRAAGREQLYDVPLADGVSIDERNEVILVRWQNRAYALSSRCTHRGAALDWRPGDGQVFCPKHKARFRPDGVHAGGRRTRDLDRYDVRRRGDTLAVDLSALRRADTEPDAWEAAVARLP